MSWQIYISDDTAAVSVGANQVAQAVVKVAMERAMTYQLVRNGSRGLLWLEPIVEIETASGRQAFGPVRAQDVADLLDDPSPLHPLALGNLEDHPWMKVQQRINFARVGVDDPLSLEFYQNHGGWIGLRNALAMGGEAIVEAVKASGLRGRGGAGFPTGVKWQTVLEAMSAQKYVVCNADEGDSGTFADRLLMEGDPYGLIEGMIIAGIAVGATRGYIYLRSEYPMAYRKLRQAIELCYDKNILGRSVFGSKSVFDLEVRLGAGAYICGEETALLESLEGKRGLVRAKPPLPALHGLFGKPTIVNNVLTLASIPWILSHGSSAYAALGVDRSRGTLAVQLGGNIRRGGLLEVPFGMSLRRVIEEFGGGTASGRPLRAVQVGGPLGAYLSERQLDVALEYEALARIAAMLGHGGIVVFDDRVDMAKQARFAYEFCAKESCGKCTPCRIGAVRGRETMDKIIAGKDVAANLKLVYDLNQVMTEASLCAMGGLTPLPVNSAIANFPEDFNEVVHHIRFSPKP